MAQQDYHDIEYIVVDPGSTDGSREIIQKHYKFISSLILTPDTGPADGLNKGFKLATGDIFYYLNADDVVFQNAFNTIVEVFKRQPNIDVVLGNGYEIDSNDAKIRPIYSSPKWTPYRYACRVARAVQPATFFRAKAFTRISGFNIENKSCWDGELLVDMVTSGARIKSVNQFLGGFRLHPASISGSGALNKIYAEDDLRIRRSILGRTPRLQEKIFSYLLKSFDYLTHPEHLIDAIKYHYIYKI